MTLEEMPPLSKNAGDEEISLFTDGDAGHDAANNNNNKSDDSEKEVMVSAGASSTISPKERDQHNSSTARIVF